MGNGISALALSATLSALFLYVLYVVIRRAVRDGIQDTRVGADPTGDTKADPLRGALPLGDPLDDKRRDPARPPKL